MPGPTPDGNFARLKLTGQDAIRGALMSDGEHRFSVYDFISNVRGHKDGGPTARSEFSRLIKDGSPFKEELEALCYCMKFPGQGQRDTPVMTIAGLHKLLLILGGNVSRAFKQEMLIVLERFLDGDYSMIDEIKTNKSIGKKRSYKTFAHRVIQQAHLYDELVNEMPPTAYVYGTKSAAFPGLIKIGRSVNPETRLISLNTGCSPAPHVIIAVSPTFDAARDEAAAHSFFSSNRKEGEFFEISSEAVQQFFSNHIMAQYQMELTQHIANRQG